jgi:hypothetical protein
MIHRRRVCRESQLETDLKGLALWLADQRHRLSWLDSPGIHAGERGDRDQLLCTQQSRLHQVLSMPR